MVSPAGDVLGLTTSQDPLELPLRSGGRVYFSALQHFTYATDERQGGLKVATRRYVYWVHTEARQRYALLNWHWHPPEILQPHLHVGVQHPTLGDLERFHLPTGRVSFEEVVRFLISDLGRWQDASGVATSVSSRSALDARNTATGGSVTCVLARPLAGSDTLTIGSSSAPTDVAGNALSPASVTVSFR